MCKIEEIVNHLKYQLHQGNLLHCFHLEVKNRDINSRVLFSNTVTSFIWEDLFLKAIKIICSVKQSLKLRDVSYSNTQKTHNTDTLNLDENMFDDNKSCL